MSDSSSEDARQRRGSLAAAASPAEAEGAERLWLDNTQAEVRGSAGVCKRACGLRLSCALRTLSQPADARSEADGGARSRERAAPRALWCGRESEGGAPPASAARRASQARSHALASPEGCLSELARLRLALSEANDRARASDEAAEAALDRAGALSVRALQAARTPLAHAGLLFGAHWRARC
jgi:hypothetical protein